MGELRFDNRVALITGAGAGCGREYALLLAKRGAKVIINDISETAAKETKVLVDNEGGISSLCIASVADGKSARRIVNDAIQHFGRLDIIINNAGKWMARQFDGYTDDEFHEVMASHFEGAWKITQAAWPHMKRQHYGRIVMVSSAAVLGPPNMAAYGAAKGALFSLANSLAIEGAEFNIIVNSLAPGAFTQTVRDTLTDPDVQKTVAKAMPVWAVAPVVAWMVHEDCRETGTLWNANGASFGKFFLGETLGTSTYQNEYTPEFVRDHVQEAFEEAGYLRPRTMMDTAPSALKRANGELKS